MEKITILIADDIGETRDNIKRLLSFEPDMEVIGEAATGEEAVRQAERLQPDVILMDINMPVLDGIGATEIISMRVPQTSIIIISVQGEQEYLKKSMVAGAREYLVKPFSSEELAETIRRVCQLEKKRRVHLMSNQTFNVKGSKEPYVITVFSTKGGVGKTTIGVNLAVALRQQTRKRVVVVDLDLQFGDVAVMFNLTPRRTLGELIQETVPLTPQLVDSYLTVHQSGIKILPAPLRPEYGELINAEQVERILDILKQTYDYIIVDTPPFFHETNLAALDQSRRILLVLTLELPTIKNVKLSLEVLESLHHLGKVRMILNRSSNEFGIKFEDVEKSLGFPISQHIPSDGKIVISSVNKGIPFVINQPGARVSQAICELAQQITREEAVGEAPAKKGLLTRMKAR